MTDVDKIFKYATNLTNGHKMGHSLRRLQEIPMSHDLLSRTGVGKVVNRLRDDEKYGSVARQLVEEWKQAARRVPVKKEVKEEIKEEERDDYGYDGREEESTSAASVAHSSANGQKTAADERERQREQSKKRAATTSSKAATPSFDPFAAALGAADKVRDAPRAKKMKPFDASSIIDALNPDPNYRPIVPSLNRNSSSTSKQKNQAEVEDGSAMFKPRTGQTKIFAGRKRAVVLTEVPTLFNLCIRVLQNHVGDIESTGSIPYHVLKPVLEKATWEQLMDIERLNPYLEEDSDELWERLVSKVYPGGKARHDEKWKEMFIRMGKDSENKLKELSQRISTHGATAEKNVRKAMAITEVKNPKFARRRQEKYGVKSGAVVDMPHALTLTKARKEIFDTGSKAALASMPSGVRNLNSTVGAHPGNKRNAPKKGALMLKSMKMCNRR